MTYIKNPPVADGSITTTKLGGDVTDAAKELLQAATKDAQREVVEVPHVLNLVRW